MLETIHFDSMTKDDLARLNGYFEPARRRFAERIMGEIRMELEDKDIEVEVEDKAEQVDATPEDVAPEDSGAVKYAYGENGLVATWVDSKGRERSRRVSADKKEPSA